MISVVIPTLNAEHGLSTCLGSLVPGLVDGVVRDVIVADGGSSDRTLEVADQAGVHVVTSEKGRGTQMTTGAKHAGGRWLLFLHGDTVLEPGWDVEVQSFIEKIETGRRPGRAAAFQFALDDDGLMPRVLEFFVGVRANLLCLPYGDQGLLISRALFDEIGGYRELDVMEDVDIVRRLGCRRVSVLRSRAITSARRYTQDGYMMRILRNQLCLVMYGLGFSNERIADVYRRSGSGK